MAHKHGSLNVPIEHHPTIRYMVYNGYYKVMSNIPKMGQFPTPHKSQCFWQKSSTDIYSIYNENFQRLCSIAGGCVPSLTPAKCLVPTHLSIQAINIDKPISYACPMCKISLLFPLYHSHMRTMVLEYESQHLPQQNHPVM